MCPTNHFWLYTDDEKQIDADIRLPIYERMTLSDQAKDYLPGKRLSAAVNVALALGQPLLVTGEPGTGKTQLAYSIAYKLGGLQVLAFNTKTTSTATDLFYRYDALRHFNDARINQSGLRAESYITFQAIGLAILLSKSAADDSRRRVNPQLPRELRVKGCIRSVVLIDEIDKAPRDFPNDILNEIEEMSFSVKEMISPGDGDENMFSAEFWADPAFRPIVVLTSNSEKNLPDAFLRRCVFHHIPFPDAARLEQIVRKRLGINSDFHSILDRVIRRFEEIRNLPLRKKPATAEFLAWVRILAKLQLETLEDPETLASTYSILAKNVEDLELMRSKATAKL